METIEVARADVFLIDEPETLKVIADERRLRILKALRRPMTVKELAHSLEISQGKLYYHVNLLEEHGLIGVVATNVVSGIIEKVYRGAARRYQVDDALFAGGDEADAQLESLLAVIFDDTKKEVKESVKAGLMKLAEGKQGNKDVIWNGRVRLSSEQRDRFFDKLEALLEEARELGEAGDESGHPTYGLTVAFYPVSRPQEASTEASVEETNRGGQR
jgi:DNA-binding transcriptional ArsR family regulator